MFLVRRGFHNCFQLHIFFFIVAVVPFYPPLNHITWEEVGFLEGEKGRYPLPGSKHLSVVALLEANDSINHEKHIFYPSERRQLLWAFYFLLHSEKIPEKGVSKINPSAPPELVLSDPV